MVPFIGAIPSSLQQTAKRLRLNSLFSQLENVNG
jgi:hypothetical protein